MARTFGPAFGINRRLGRNREGNLGEWIFVGVGKMRRIAAVVFKGPVGDALLAKVADLQMNCPLREDEMPLDQRLQTLVQIRLVAGNARAELRHEVGSAWEGFRVGGWREALSRISGHPPVRKAGAL